MYVPFTGLALTSFRPSGIVFEAPFAPIFDAEKEKVQVGDLVSFFHSGYYPHSAKPRQPAVYLERVD